MKRFKFSLQTLHDLREQERSDAEHALAQAAAEVAAAAAHIEVLRDTINQALAALTVNLQTKAPNARAKPKCMQNISPHWTSAWPPHARITPTANVTAKQNYKS